MFKRSVMMYDNIGWTFGRIESKTPNGFLVRRHDGLTTVVHKQRYRIFWRLISLRQRSWHNQQLQMLRKLMRG